MAEEILCPSSTCEEGVLLLGIVLPDGRVAFSGSRIVVDRSFVESAQATGEPEKRFRFGGACIKGACQQWSQGRCGVIDEVLAASPSTEAAQDLPPCHIRADCRWFRQAGGVACSVCPDVVTDARREV